MYPDHYFPNLTEPQRAANAFHNSALSNSSFDVKMPTTLGHCLEILRQGIMCHSDTQLLTMKWSKITRVPVGNFSNPHKCVKWEDLNHWAQMRRVDVLKPGYLMHPTLGPAFPADDNDHYNLNKIGNFVNSEST